MFFILVSLRKVLLRSRPAWHRSRNNKVDAPEPPGPSQAPQALACGEVQGTPGRSEQEHNTPLKTSGYTSKGDKNRLHQMFTRTNLNVVRFWVNLLFCTNTQN